MSYHDRNPDEEFWRRVVDDPVGNQGCWLWVGRSSTNGYGRFRIRGEEFPAHRWAYERFIGPVPAGLELDHLCRKRHCVNPGHLEPVTHRENTLRGDTVVAANAAKTHCIHGHPLSGGNLFIDCRGYRQCRTCRLDRQRERSARMSECSA